MPLSPDSIKRYRQENGWSQEHLAEIAGISLRTVQRVEVDGNCSPETHMALASAFGVPPKDLFAEETSATPKKLDWSALLGFVFVCALILVAVILSIEVRLFFNMPGFVFVIGLVLGLSLMSNGAAGTGQALTSLKCIFYAARPLGQTATPLLRRLIQHCYAAGVLAACIGLVQMLFNGGFDHSDLQHTLAVLALPVLYSLILAEVIVRPAKMRTERAGIT